MSPSTCPGPSGEHVPLHFWPGPVPAFRQPGAHSPCGARAVPLLGTAVPGNVTCKRCLRSSAYRTEVARRGLNGVPLHSAAAWTVEQLFAFGLLDADAPPPSPPPPPHRNPNLYPPPRAPLPPGPLAAMVDRWDERAARAPGDVRAALTSCASELHDLLAEALQ